MSEIKNFIIEDGVLKKYTGYDTEITIPDGVTVIGKKAFKSNSMRKVVMPESVIEIGESAFCGCLYLEEVQLSPKLQTIGKYAFYLCKFKSIEIPSSVKVIGDQAFGFDLKNITLLCENAKISGTAFNWDAKFSGPKKLYDRLLEENVSFKYGKKRWKNIEVSLEKCSFESQMPIVKNASDIKNTVNSDVEVIIDQLKAKYADYPAYALKQVEMECKDISLSKLKKWLNETQSKTLGDYLQEIGVVDAYKHSQVMEARKKEEKEIREQQKKDFAANLENNKSYDDCESNLIFVDSEYDQLKICENFDNVQKFATVKTESGATLELRVGETVSVSDNSEYALPLNKKVVQFFNESYYTFILFEDGKIRSVKCRHPRTEITVWKSIAADVEQLSNIKDFLVFKPLMCGQDVAPSMVFVYTNGTVSIIKGKKSAEQYDSVLNKVASATNIEHVFEFNGDLAVFFKDGQIKIWGSGKDALSKYKFNFVKYLTNSDYLITTDNSYVLVHGSMGIIHELKNTVKIIYDSYNLYFLTDKYYFLETGWREKDEKNKTFNQKGTIKDFWVKKAYSEDPKIVVLYEEGYAITSNGFSKFNVINNVSGATYENGKMCLYISNNKEAVLSVEQKSDFSVEKIKKHSLQTLEQIYRRLGQRKYYYQGTSGLFEIRISELDYELLERDSLFKKYAEKTENYASSAISQLRNPYFKNSAIRTASFENAAIFQWEDIVSVVELAYFINMYNVPSFTMELYLAESEYDKPFCFTITNKDEYFKIKTKRV